MKRPGTQDQLSVLVEYHMEQDMVILIQTETAEIIRWNIDSEFHSLFDLPHAHLGT
jgi:hypothetical protein